MAEYNAKQAKELEEKRKRQNGEERTNGAGERQENIYTFFLRRKWTKITKICQKDFQSDLYKAVCVSKILQFLKARTYRKWFCIFSFIRD